MVVVVDNLQRGKLDEDFCRYYKIHVLLLLKLMLQISALLSH